MVESTSPCKGDDEVTVIDAHPTHIRLPQPSPPTPMSIITRRLVQTLIGCERCTYTYLVRFDTSCLRQLAHHDNDNLVGLDFAASPSTSSPKSCLLCGAAHFTT